jgi:hypothetical protein
MARSSVIERIEDLLTEFNRIQEIRLFLTRALSELPEPNPMDGDQVFHVEQERLRITTALTNARKYTKQRIDILRLLVPVAFKSLMEQNQLNDTNLAGSIVLDAVRMLDHVTQHPSYFE